MDMDVDSLRAELEEHLKKNTDEHAPHGFRDRFDTLAVELGEAGDAGSKSALEAQLHQVRVEAEAAAKCCEGGHAADTPEHPPGAAAPEAAPAAIAPEPAAAAAAPAAQMDDQRSAAEGKAWAGDMATAPAPGFLQRFGIPLLIVVILLIAAWLYLRR
jgi:hypothetical protein